ncbi:hypothetical protein [Nannocystis pusilla]|uniref:B box-type domain-containing protein n=1 Tax=Nannocystis pusilla TaxID=889268 RepID=A0ABS7TLI7_9BACT|nr:hypothetical protein [Nannocystis pusilla]MBZ5709061.1 hypothetical protein [Nannocystis pusilla]
MPDSSSACHHHRDRSPVARCSLCSAAMCDECWRFRVGRRGAALDACDRPACAPCAYVATSHRGRRLALAFAFLALAAGSAPLVALRWQLWPDYKLSLGLFALVILLVFAYLLYSAFEPSLPVQPRGEHDAADDDHVMDGAEHPLRGRGRRVVSALSPKLSGTTAAVVAGLAFALTAVLLPHALALPRWLEIEAVLAAWWALSTLAFAALLHRGFHLVDDWLYFAPWNRPREGKGRGCGDGCSGADFPGGDGEGCLIMIVVAALVLLFFGAAWLLVEVAGPLLFLLIYLLVTRALARVARDRHDCKGELARSLAWGAAWATIYLLPLAILAYAIHTALQPG